MKKLRLKLPRVLEKHREYLESTLQPSNRMTFTLEETAPWESKLGGCPYMEDISQYPKDENGAPMVFLAQLNLSEMPPLPDFPTDGLLQFYIANDGIFGLNGWKVIYIPAYTKDTGILITENPYRDGDYKEGEPFEKCGKISFRQEMQPITASCRTFQQRFYDKVSEKEEDALYDVCDALGSRVGGYPWFDQHAPAYYDSGQFNVLLLQLDCDEEETVNIHYNGGSCAFLISREDLLKRSFSKVQYDWQST